MPEKFEWESTEENGRSEIWYPKVTWFIEVQDRAVNILLMHVDRKGKPGKFGKEKQSMLSFLK